VTPGTLYIVASPIGNLEDITLRALRVLREEADLVYCEDTRQTRKLLMQYAISIPVRSLHAQSSEEKQNAAVHTLLEGKSIAYLTDSGTPGVSDPGSLLVRRAREAGIPVVPLPGPSALAAVISVCGFPEKSVIFTGFLSKKEGRARRELEALKSRPGVIVIYESPYRIKRLLGIIHEVFPDSEVLIAREMTKLFEEFITGTMAEIMEKAGSIKEKGEFTVAVYNKNKPLKGE
jgi:16S rRNA (cytidine1402-2'-O)-methyltransferase